jgi:hypothetical protein
MLEYAEPAGYLTRPVSRNRTRLRASARRISVLSVVLLALMIAGCFSNTAQHKSTAYRIGSPRQRSGTQVAPLPAPQCELVVRRPNTVDDELWARLKLDYERHCYQQAEMLVRKRLQRLLTSGKCRIGT